MKDHQPSWLMQGWVRDHLTRPSSLDAFPALKQKITLRSEKESRLRSAYQDYFIALQYYSELPDHLACEWYDSTVVRWDTSKFVQWDKSKFLFSHHDFSHSYIDLNWNLDFQLNSLEAEVQHWYDKIDEWFSETPDAIRTSEGWLQRFHEKVQHIQRSVEGILNRVRALRRVLSSPSTLKLDFRLTIRKKICVLFKILDDEHLIVR
ncbi:hypothetical protein ACFQ21_05110 [Ohtaekwangia kribbensis]|uniref:Uncharacterized protein n=1 Tax=Ohtaekwangia kribbensis TaxID=688913 RepID=A0ABW3JXE7_9BACT